MTTTEQQALPASGQQYPVPRVNGTRGEGRRREQKRPEPVGAVRETDAAQRIDDVQTLRSELADERVAVCLELAMGLGLERSRYASGWILTLPAPLDTRRVLLTPGGRLRPVRDIEAALGEPITAKEAFAAAAKQKGTDDDSNPTPPVATGL